MLVPLLKRAGVVGKIDSAVLQATCELWGLYRAAFAVAQKDPTDKDARIAVTSYFAAWERSAAKLGLSPVDRAKLDGDFGDDDPADIMDEFIDKPRSMAELLRSRPSA